MESHWIALDIETAPAPDVDLPVPTPARNLKDPDKIAADITAKLEAQRDKLPLDPWASRPCVLSYMTEADDEPIVLTMLDDDALRAGLVTLKRALRTPEGHSRHILGFCVRRFDLPHLLHHYRRLDIVPPGFDLRRWGNIQVTDLYDLLCDDDCEHVLPRSLKSTCRVYGIDLADDDIDGRDVAALVAAGDEASLDAVRRHCALDVLRVVQLAAKVGVIPARLEVLA